MRKERQLKTLEMFGSAQKVWSFEIFPPKRTDPIDTIFTTLDGLSDLRPDFISVTFGAGGSENDSATVQIARMVKQDYGIESVAHLACLYQSKDDVLRILDGLRAAGVENILALRGDRAKGVEVKRDFEHASDLIAFIREQAGDDFDILAACYPETHPEASDAQADIANLKLKQDAGATHLITQLFFDNAVFYDFVRRARTAGVTIPIEAGIMPVVNGRQIKRMATLCGADLPDKFTHMMARFDGNSRAMHDAGIAYAVDQIVDLLVHDVDGIHLYTMNKPGVARRINAATRSLFAC